MAAYATQPTQKRVTRKVAYTVHGGHRITRSQGRRLTFATTVAGNSAVRRHMTRKYTGSNNAQVYRTLNVINHKSGIHNRMVMTIGKSHRQFNRADRRASYHYKGSLATKGGLQSAGVYVSSGQVMRYGSNRKKIVARNKAARARARGAHHRRTFWARDSHGRFN